jgi:hypothetical protein
LLVFHAYINEQHGSRSKIPGTKSRPYIHDVKFLALLGAPYIYDISRLRVNNLQYWGHVRNVVDTLSVSVKLLFFVAISTNIYTKATDTSNAHETKHAYSSTEAEKNKFLASLKHN